MVPLPQAQAATSALVYLPGAVAQEPANAPGLLRFIPPDGTQTMRQGAPPRPRSTGRNSPFSVGMLLNRYQYGTPLPAHVEDPAASGTKRWCPPPPPPAVRNSWSWGRGTSRKTPGDQGVELSVLPNIPISVEDDAEAGNRTDGRVCDALDEDEEEDECVVCMEKIRVGDDVSSLTCKHVFHYECIQSWFVQELNDHGVATCPVCKVMVFDARHLRPIAVEEGHYQPLFPPPRRERTQIEILLHVGDEFTPCHERCAKVLTALVCSGLIFIAVSAVWIVIQNIQGALNS